MTNLTIKTPSARSIPCIAEMIASLYEHEEIEFDYEEVTRNLESMLDGQRRGEVLLLESDGDTIGYAILVYFFSLEYGGDTVLLDELFIKEKHRGSGLGRQAISVILERCRKKGAHAVQLEVGNDNRRAARLYDTSGFEQVERKLMVHRLEEPTSKLLPIAVPFSPGKEPGDFESYAEAYARVVAPVIAAQEVENETSSTKPIMMAVAAAVLIVTAIVALPTV